MNTAPKQNWWPTAVCGLLLLMVVAVFGQTIWHDFVYDDRAYVYDNPHVTQGLNQATVVWSLTSFDSSNWHPLTWLSHALDCQLYGSKLAAGHHLTNVVLHAAVAISLFLVLWRMTGSLWPSAFVAAVFAVHPLRAESVAWVAERKDLLSGLFFMLMLAAYLNYVRRPFSVLRYLGVMAALALGLTAKPMLVTAPCVLLLLDYWPLQRIKAPAAKSLGLLTLEKIPLLVLAGVSCLVTSLAQRHSMAASECLPIAWRAGNAVVAYVAYVGQFFWPANLAVFYPHPENALPLWKIVVAVATLVAISAGAWMARRRAPYLLVGWLWYLGILVPVIGLVQVGDQARADRYTYLPQIGLCIAIAWGVAALVARSSAEAFEPSQPLRQLQRHWLTAAFSIGLVVVLAVAARQQTSYWRNDETLWRHALDCTDRNATAEFNLGVALMQRGDDAEAMKRFERSIAISPRSADAQNDLGVLLAKAGQLDKAADCFRAALQSRPSLADAHGNLGTVLQQQGNNAEALTHWREAARLDPDNPRAANRLAWALATLPDASLRNGAEAIASARRAVELSGGREPIMLGTLAAAHAEAGQFSEAVSTADRAILLADAQGDAATAATIRRQCQSYRSGIPYHASFAPRRKDGGVTP